MCEGMKMLKRFFVKQGIEAYWDIWYDDLPTIHVWNDLAKKHKLTQNDKEFLLALQILF